MYSVFEKLLKERNMKVSDVAKGTGISPSTFTDWKKGLYTPKQNKLIKISEFFNVPFSVFTETQDPLQPVYSPQIQDFIQRLIKLPSEYQKAVYDVLRGQEILYESRQVKKDSSASSKEA